MRVKSTYDQSRVGQNSVAKKGRPNFSSPVKPINFNGRTKKALKVYNAELSGRFTLSRLIGDPSKARWLTGLSGGNAKIYTDEYIRILARVQAAYRLPLRATEGMVRDYLGKLGVDLPVPDFSTISRRMRKLGALMVKAEGSDWAVDSTGIGCSGVGEYRKKRFQLSDKSGKLKFVKLHAVVDLLSGSVVACSVTPAAGKGTGDISQGRALLPQVDGDFESLSADGAYDSEDFRRQARKAGGNLLAPLPINVAYSKRNPLRNELKHQIGKLGEDVWRKRSGYSYRALVENVFSVLKRCLGSRVRARSFEGQRAEITARVELYNFWIGQTRTEAA